MRNLKCNIERGINVRPLPFVSISVLCLICIGYRIARYDCECRNQIELKIGT